MTEPDATPGRRHPRALVATALTVAFVVLGTGSLFAGVAVGSAEPVAVPTPTPTPTATPEPDPRPVPDELVAAQGIRSCSIDALARDGRLRELSGSVVNADTGEILFDRAADRPVRTASVLKVLTAAAALATLGPDHRLTTRVVDGVEPGAVALVGGGDATLSRLPPGQESFYRGAPKLADLAAQTVAAYAAAHPDAPAIREVVLDATYWDPADKWDPSWARSEQTIGYQSEVTALQVDADRANPVAGTSPRSTDPVARAGQAFAQALAVAGNAGGTPITSLGSAPDTDTLGVVRSQPVSTLIPQMLLTSDNALGEMLARVVSKNLGLDGSAASLTSAFRIALDEYGVPVTGLTIRDGSGLSHLNAVPPSYVTRLMVRIADGEGSLSHIAQGLPVAGQFGSLSSRFTGANAIARGAVAAKTGWIDTSYSLAGIVTAQDGTRLTFGFFAVGEGIQGNARAALDTVTTGVYTCGNTLSTT
ncbi:MAG: D-alanyl-D-alanine carboxypeptidase/D-alanyl-D-alanine-endopeptidase [Leifsonia sp.]|nr:D-alanyl-D-alanine carboxypeptidase/D-alanyl-D-alanine-endopeptidase [Leifsonia sp.]